MRIGSDRRFVGFASIHCAGIVLGTVLACAAGPASPDRMEQQTSDADVLAGSELEYTESGGFAGRVHQARLIATAGRVEVEYRPAESPRAGVLRGTLEAARYTELWREAERIGIWTMSSPPKSRGADMMEYELRARLATKSHAVRWRPEAPAPDALAGAADLGRRILAAARDVTVLR
jgi:hypothetical protein